MAVWAVRVQGSATAGCQHPVRLYTSCSWQPSSLSTEKVMGLRSQAAVQGRGASRTENVQPTQATHSRRAPAARTPPRPRPALVCGGCRDSPVGMWHSAPSLGQMAGAVHCKPTRESVLQQVPAAMQVLPQRMPEVQAHWASPSAAHCSGAGHARPTLGSERQQVVSRMQRPPHPTEPSGQARQTPPEDVWLKSNVRESPRPSRDT